MSLQDVAIVGTHVTEQARSLAHRTSADLTMEALLGALADAGLEPSDVDGLAVEWPGPGGHDRDGSSWADVFGPLRWVADDFMDCAGIRGVLKAAAAISAGLCDTVVVGGGRAGPWSVGGKAVGTDLGLEFSDCWGAYVAPHFALFADRHMSDFGTSAEAIAGVAATIRNHGHGNPEAAMYGKGPYTIDDVMASRMITTPFHLLELCIVAEGGAAIVLTRRERARDLDGAIPVAILGAGMHTMGPSYAAPAVYRDVRDLGRSAAERALQGAGCAIGDIGAFSLYDPTAFEPIWQFEILGACAEGEGGQLVDEGRALALDGTHPTNLDGGNLSHSWNGVQQMTIRFVEAIRQVQGRAGEHQVPGAELVLATNGGSAAKHIEIAVLGRAS